MNLNKDLLYIYKGQTLVNGVGSILKSEVFKNGLPKLVRMKLMKLNKLVSSS